MTTRQRWKLRQPPSLPVSPYAKMYRWPAVSHRHGISYAFNTCQRADCDDMGKAFVYQLGDAARKLELGFRADRMLCVAHWVEQAQFDIAMIEVNEAVPPLLT